MSDTCNSWPPEAQRFPGDEEDWTGCLCALPRGHESDHKCERRMDMEEIVENTGDEIYQIIIRENEYHRTWPVRVEELISTNRKKERIN